MSFLTAAVARRRDAQIEADGNYSLAGPSMQDALPEVDERFENGLREMNRSVKSEQNRLVPQTPPLYQLSPVQRQRVYNGINFITELIGQNIIRPTNPAQLRELRRREAAAHSSSSASGVQLYKPGDANLKYVTQRPATWAETAGRNFVSADAQLLSDGGVGPHQHTLDDTLLLDVRMAMQKRHTVTAEPLPEMIRDAHFPYFMLAPDDRRTLQLLSQHTAFLNYANQLYRETLPTPGAVGGAAAAAAVDAVCELRVAIERARRETGLALACVLFRYDAHSLEIVLQINAEASFFGVLAYSVAERRSVNMVELRKNVRAELDAVYARDLADAAEPPPTLRALGDNPDALAPRVAPSCEYYKAHEHCDANSTRCERLVARSSPLRVSAPQKSELLGRIQVRYRYAVFLSCQCLANEEDLWRFRRRIGLLARAQRHARAARAVDAAELLPAYDSDTDAFTSREGATSADNGTKKRAHTATEKE